jgi:hypothetical protein
LKKNLIEANKTHSLNWNDLKNEADTIVSTLREAGQSLYDTIPGKPIAPFMPKVQPLSPPLKSGPTVSPTTVSKNFPSHKATSTASTQTTAGIPIAEPYKLIPAIKMYEGKQRNACFNCSSDLPTRHYYLQCQQLCQFPECQQNSCLCHKEATRSG